MPPLITATQQEKRKRLANLAAVPGRPASKPKVAITDINAQAVREPVSGKISVLVTLKTDAGITGLGETSARSDVQAVLSRVDRLKRQLKGHDALAVEAVNQSLRQFAHGKRPHDRGIPAALNMAMLDVLGKLSNAPVYETLGGPTRNKARALAQLNAKSEAEIVALVQQAAQAGFRAFQVPLPDSIGPARGRSFYRRVYQLFARLRDAAGPASDFVLNCQGRLSPAAVTGLAKEFERFHLLWIDPSSQHVTAKALNKISQESVTPIGFGLDATHSSDFQELLRQDAVDILRPDVSQSGITEIRKTAALAETYYVAVAPRQSAGPIATAAALHAAASIPNFFIQEVPFPADDRDRRMRRELTVTPIEAIDDGFLSLPTGLGLGIELNQAAVEKYSVS